MMFMVLCLLVPSWLMFCSESYPDRIKSWQNHVPFPRRSARTCCNVTLEVEVCGWLAERPEARPSCRGSASPGTSRRLS
jgi:hypothetical protein